MKMRTKMIAVFFTMILAIVVINTYYIHRSNLVESQESTQNRFRHMSTIMMSEADRYLNLMDLAIEDLTSDVTFMDAFSQIAAHGDIDPMATQVWQNRMSNKLYHSAVAENFYRVSIFSKNGFYLSNHIDRNDSLVSLSDEAQEIIESIPYLEMAEQTPYQWHVVAPHADYFTLGKTATVFSLIRCITLHGETIGFIEVSADADELNTLFLTDNENVMVYAIFKDGTVLYDTGLPDVSYEDIPLNQFLLYESGGTQLNVYHSQNRWLGMDLYLSQDYAVLNQIRLSMMGKYLRFSAVTAIIALIMVLIFSNRMTRSIRLLTTKVQTLQAENVIRVKDPPKVDTIVTSPSDTEIHALEKHFNTLMVNLQNATKNEISMRESTTTARLNALQAQINPHFVYNTLNIIAAKGLESGSEEVTDLCAQFGQMLRYSTDFRSKTVELREDVEHVTNYLMLLKSRWQDALEYTISIPPEMNHIRIPRLTLQPLVENSISHGFSQIGDIRRISIRGELRNQEMLLEVRDNGQGFPPDTLIQIQESIRNIIAHPGKEPIANGHIGLANTCWRLLHYSDSASFSMQVLNDHGAVVRLQLSLISR